ncbi:hypothetical protein BGZ65_003494 [Modicella reniformis]|uniref:NAD-dependent epimerase/dehydratase domain-containing protein n=1 Tax=Modicella reniformis TaxID=1440133 RepID=A0A9P6IL10_9FUNG|nr:hypothetical protein BGZ65_003494 [Modicella reniformis]
MAVPQNGQNTQETILVTGGAGYIGSHTVIQLLNLGKRLVIVDNLCNSSEEALHRTLALSHNRRCPGSLIFHKVDLLDGEALKQIFDLYTFSACLHFAGLKAVGESSEIPLGYYQTNITGTLNLVQLLQRYHCRNLIFSSSATVYGLPSPSLSSPSRSALSTSTTSSEYQSIKEDSPMGATNPYGRTKQYIEEILRDTAKSEPNQWNIILLRYFNPVGAHGSGQLGEDPSGIPNNLMPYVAQVAIGRRPRVQVFGNDYETKDGTGVRDYIHIEDLARGHIAALRKIEAVLCRQASSNNDNNDNNNNNKSLGCVAYNLGTGVGYSVMEMIYSMSEVVGRPLPYQVVKRRPGDVGMVIADSSLAAQDLGWKAEKTLKDMCRDLWKWQTLNPEGYSSGSKSKDSTERPLTPLLGSHLSSSYVLLPTAAMTSMEGVSLATCRLPKRITSSSSLSSVATPATKKIVLFDGHGWLSTPSCLPPLITGFSLVNPPSPPAHYC